MRLEGKQKPGSVDVDQGEVLGCSVVMEENPGELEV